MWNSVHKLRTAYTSYTTVDEVVWLTVKGSLTEIGDRIEEWGYLVALPGQQPNIRTVEEIVGALAQLHVELNGFQHWVETQHDQRWVTLAAQLRQLLRKGIWHETRRLISTYKQVYDTLLESKRPFSRANIRTLDDERMKAGDKMVSFARAIKAAIMYAEMPF